MVLVIQSATGHGQRIEAIISDDNNVIVENGNFTIECGSSDKLMITPGLVRKVIQDAHELGWAPEENTKPLKLYLDQESMKLLRPS